METLYQTIWAGDGCVAIAAQVGLIALAACAGALVLIAAIVRFALRRQPDGGRVTWWILGGSGLLIFGVILAALVGGASTHRVWVSESGFVFEGCDGLSAFTESVPFRDVASAAHRTRLSGGRSPRPVDEVVLTLRGGGESRVIPLSTDPATLDPAVFHRVMPAQVIDAYREALRQRGVTVPEGL